MPDELPLTTPPILQVAWLAGIGPSLPAASALAGLRHDDRRPEVMRSPPSSTGTFLEGRPARPAPFNDWPPSEVLAA